MVAAWQDFDWRAVEGRINGHPNFLAEIDGQPVHFIHVRAKAEGATPLLLAHTYPGSVLDYLDMIGPLTDPQAHGGEATDAFDVVIPSMPGTGFSQPLNGGGWTIARAAAVYDTLMRGLGYQSYGVHGSDMGAMVARELVLLEPAGFLGAPRAAVVLLPVRRSRGVRELRGQGTPRLGAPAVVPVGGWVQQHERCPASDDRCRAD